jgi:hypothetical protein
MSGVVAGLDWRAALAVLGDLPVKIVRPLLSAAEDGALAGLAKRAEQGSAGPDSSGEPMGIGRAP